MKSIFLFLAIFFMAAIPAYSQNALAEGDALFEAGKYAEAKAKYTVWKMDSNDRIAYADQRIGQCDQCIQLFTIADYLFSSGQFSEGLEKYKDILMQNPNDPIANEKLDEMRKSTLIPIERNNKWGFLEKWGKTIVIPTVYDFVFLFSERLSLIKENEKYGYIDKTGKTIISPIYDQAESFSEGLACVMINDKWGFIDSTGNLIIHATYDDAGSFKEGLARIKKDEKWGAINKTGEVVIPLIYEDIGSLCEGMVCIKQEGKWGFVDKTSKMIIPPIYKQVGFFEEGLAPVQSSGSYNNWGYIDKTGTVIITFTYDRAGIFREGLAPIDLNSELCFINKTGKIIIKGRARFIDRVSGKETSQSYGIPFYEDIDAFYEGLARIKKDGRWGFIDKTGSMIISAVYDYVENFNGGLARVQQNGKWYYIDRDWNEYK